MLDDFSSYVLDKCGLDPSAQSYLLAVSGGVDSMVLLDMCHKLGWTIAVAHVDHHSRGGQSSADADFVERYCSERSIPFHLGHYRHEKGNFQAQARAFRYAFFRSLMDGQDYDVLFTAHHHDDLAETILMALGRGASLASLTALSRPQPDLVRPLLPYTKATLLAYAQEQGIAYVYDASNDTDAYTRNRIRRHVLPALADAIPNFSAGLKQSATALTADAELFDELLAQVSQSATTKTPRYMSIHLPTIQGYRSATQLLYHILRPYGFTPTHASNMLAAETGAQFHTASHLALRDRDCLLLRPLGKKEFSEDIILDRLGEYGFDDYGIDVLSQDIVGLSVGYRKGGESLRLSSGHRKSLKKLLIDRRVNRWDKEEVLLLKKDGQLLDILYPKHLSQSQDWSEKIKVRVISERESA